MGSNPNTVTIFPVASWTVTGKNACVILSGRISADTLGHLWQDIRQAQSQWLMQTTGSKTLANGLQQALATILQNYENDLYAGTKNLPRPLGQQKLLGK